MALENPMHFCSFLDLLFSHIFTVFFSFPPLKVGTVVSNSSRIASDTRKSYRGLPSVETGDKAIHSTQLDDRVIDISWAITIINFHLSAVRKYIGWDNHRSKYVTGNTRQSGLLDYKIRLEDATYAVR